MFKIRIIHQLVLVFVICHLIACTSNPPAPVIDRAPSPPKAPNTSTPVNKSSDWRPTSHIVKKGDTLFAIGLEYGYDYKEIALANNLTPPYAIKIGQKLVLPNALANEKSVDKTNSEKTSPVPNGDVVVTPIKIDPPIEVKPTNTAVTPVITQPKATREVYSNEAYQRNSTKPPPSQPVVKPAETDVIATKPSEIKSTDDENIQWLWPTNGKIVSNFNEGSNKGIDIAGSLGQSVNAASAGKVIYSGSDLRGYGKLVIIKHNKTYLSVYAHNNKILVKEGQMVAAGQKIAEMGNTDSTAIKLHFEIRRQGKSVDPATYLKR